MERKTKLYVLFGCLTIIIVFFNRASIYQLYIKIVKKSTILENRNNKGQLDGEVTSYINGNIYLKANFKNGLKNGWAMKYFGNGQVKNKSFYKDDKLDGVENEYYENGRPHYESNYKYGRYYGNGWNWLKNGKLFVYNTSDVSNNLFYYSEFDSVGRPTKVIGEVFSRNIFSINDKDGSVILLNDRQSFDSINDLYITVATPPQLLPQIDININKTHSSYLKIDDNTIQIKNAFTGKGAYKMDIYGHLLDKNKRTVKSDTLTMMINKK
jgi:hypothetical protein